MIKKEKDLLAEFNQLKPYLEEWGKIVDSYLIDVCDKYFSETNYIKEKPEFRIKDDISFLSKALYRYKTYKNIMLEIEDKVGTRIIFLTSNNIFEFLQQIEKENFDWDIIKTRDFRQESFEFPNSFDYQSLHLVVKPKENSEKFEKNIIPLITCEIQLRTILQHALAEVSHNTTYKGPFRNDKSILRSLSKSIALMEATDDYFVQIFNMMQDKQNNYKNFHARLISLYKNLVTGFNEDRIDNRITDKIFELIDNLKISIDEVDKFCQQNSDDLKRFIVLNDSIINNQPIILLIAYCIKNKPRKLKEYWPLYESILEDIFIQLGYSYEQY